MLDELVKLKISVHMLRKSSFPLRLFGSRRHGLTGTHAPSYWSAYREKNGHAEIADQLDKCQIAFKCFRTTWIHNVFENKRTYESRLGDDCDNI